MTIDFQDHDVVVRQLETDQADEKDVRDLSRLQQRFLSAAPDAMWEDDIVKKFGERPRYTFDMISHQIDQTAGEIEQNEFQAKVDALGSGASKETAKTLNGLVRNIQVSSNASRIYQRAGKKMLKIGMDGWRVFSEFESQKSSKQVLKIQKIDNAINRIWFDSNSVEEDRSDARWVFDLRALSPSVYEEKFPKGKKQSLSENNTNPLGGNRINDQREVIVVGEFLYKKEIVKEVIEFSDGSIHENNDKLKGLMDEMADQGITPVRDPVKRESFEVKSRWFDAGSWLTDEKDTPFDLLPVCVVYGDFDVIDNQVSYEGMTLKLMDAQMVLNYAESRKIEEGAISPRAKIWMTETQSAGHETELEQMNVSATPIQLYTFDKDNPAPPFPTPGPQVNQSLSETSASMQQMIQTSTNQHTDPQRTLVSGVALERAENKGNTSNIKYHNSLMVGIQYTCQVLMGAIPVVYDTRDRQIRILEEDGTADIVTINKTIRNEETGKLETLNDFSIGDFDITCSVGAAFKNRQQEAINAQLRLAEVLPGSLEQSADIFVGNIQAPGMEMVRERLRKRLFDEGQIPESQWTDEEKKEVEEEIQRLQAEQEAAGQQTDPVTEAVVADAASQIQDRETQTELDIAKMQQDLEKQQQDFFIKQEELDLKRQEQQRKDFETQIKALGDLTEAWTKGISGPPTIGTVDNQARLVLQSQNQVSKDLPTNSSDISEPSAL